MPFPYGGSRVSSDAIANAMQSQVNAGARSPYNRLICYHAVAQSLFDANLIDGQQLNQLHAQLSPGSYQALFPQGSRNIIIGLSELRLLPRGTLLGFFKKPRDGAPSTMAHAAVKVGTPGDARVAGINGAGVGLPNGLATADMATIREVDWSGAGVGYSYLFHDVLAGSRTDVQIRYREW